HSVRGFSCSLFFGPAGPISLKTVHRTVFRALDVPVPFVLPSAFPPTARQIRIYPIEQIPVPFICVFGEPLPYLIAKTPSTVV
ncbi:MAG: hypothetical protein IJ119_14710, partial [Clostridia bacterium]|nr:hypothetical protein [Clostridia bacterium]